MHVFNGRGDEWRAVVDEVGRSRASVRLVASIAPAPEPRQSLFLAIAVLKGDKMDDVVRDAVMLGVSGITGLVTTRTEIAKRSINSAHRVQRWHRIAVSSAKQCGRATVPLVGGPVLFDRFLAPPWPDHRRVMLVEPGASVQATPLTELRPLRLTELVVGPEGGWTPEEITAAEQSSCMLVTLGGITLRADAVPLVAISALRALWNDF